MLPLISVFLGYSSQQNASHVEHTQHVSNHYHSQI